MVSRWLGMREMQARRVRTNAKTKEVVMANGEQRSNREKKKPKKDKPKGAPVISSFTTESSQTARKKK